MGSWTTASTKLGAISSQLGAEAGVARRAVAPLVTTPRTGRRSQSHHRHALGRRQDGLHTGQAHRNEGRGGGSDPIADRRVDDQTLAQPGEQLVGAVTGAIASPALTPTP